MYFDIYIEKLEDPAVSGQRQAIFLPDGQGKYRLDRIEVFSAAETETDSNAETLKSAYNAILDKVAAGDSAYMISYSMDGTYSYCLYDMDGDGTQELLVATDVLATHTLIVPQYLVFGCNADGSTRFFSGTNLLRCAIPEDHNGLYTWGASQGTGQASYTRVTVNGDTLVAASEPDYEYNMFNENTPAPELEELVMTDISDRSVLDALGQ